MTMKEKELKIQRIVYVKNNLGLHIRPAAAIVKLLQSFRSKVFFTYKKKTVDAKSMMNLLMLTVKKNEKIVISVQGEDAEETMQSLIIVFEKHFGEFL